jgi:aconitate hydratase
MAGPWLRFRGHLDNISDNAFIGAINAYTDQPGTGLDVVSGETGVPFPKIARHYKAEGLSWIVVGDENYGEGSSREHAAMCPRHLGAAAIVARSYARIHEANLKKQGVLPLTFEDPADYDRVRETDRVSIGLQDLGVDKPLLLTLQHDDGSKESFRVEHTLNAEQIEWFRAGSALNTLRS